MPVYSSTSPYSKTELTNGYLNVLEPRTISSKSSDIEYELDAKYENRPDLLAYDLYGDSGLWWVFSVRNKNIIKDPIFSMVPGLKIFIPQLTSLRSELGI